MNLYLFGKQPMLSVEIGSQKSDAHNTFPCRLILTDTTTTLTANELKFITVIAPAFLIFICSWRIQKHRQYLTPRSFLPRYFQSLSLFFFVALIHVEIEMRAHRQMLQILNQEREDTNELRNIVVRQEETIDSVLKILLSGSPKGKCILIKLALVYNFSIFF